MAEPADMIIPILREMRAESHSEHELTRKMIAALEKRIGKVEEAQVSYRQGMIADTLLGKLVTGEFEERIQALEEKLRTFEGRS